MSLSDVCRESVLAMAAVRTSPSLTPEAAALILASASSPVELRAGSTAPSSSFLARVVPPASSVQVYVFAGQPSLLAADGTTATPTGEEATLPRLVTCVAEPVSATRSTHASESGTHTCTSDFLPAPSEAATSYDSRAVTPTSRQRPSEVTFFSRASFATARSAGAMSGEAATSMCMTSSPQEPPKENRPPRTAAAVPPTTVRTSAVARAVLRRRARIRGSAEPARRASGKL